jgi:hypothetical protein
MGFWDKLFKAEADDVAHGIRNIAGSAATGAAGSAAKYFTERELHKHFDSPQSTQRPPQSPQVYKTSSPYHLPDGTVCENLSDGSFLRHWGNGVITQEDRWGNRRRIQ